MNKLDIIAPRSATGRLHDPVPHDSAKHVAGRAEYVDDLTEPEGTLHAYLGIATRAHAEIASMDLEAVRRAPGVVGVLTAEDVPGENDVSSVHKHDEPVFAEGRVVYWGQPVFCVVALDRDSARRAAKLAHIDYRELPQVIEIPAALRAGGRLVTEPLTLERGDVEAGLARSPRRVKGTVTMGGQEHFYLEGQVALAIPGEDDELTLHLSTQHPTEIQVMVAQVLAIPHAAVTVNMRRMGGGFGGKETQGNLFAAVAALAARKFRRAVKIRPDRDDDFQITGKRHDFVVSYDVGYDDDGRIEAVAATYAARAGYSADLSGPVTDRALFHADNAYYFPNVRVSSLPLFTNTQSNTAFRGFGGPQGIVGCERWIEDIAYDLGLDPLEVRKRNFYGTEDRNVTPYHQVVEDNIIHKVVDELERTSDYQRRRQAVLAFNREHKILRKGIALTPVKFGISFTATWHNQAGALVHVYRDGSVQLSHGGTEMGQGLHIKVMQVVADAFGIPVGDVKIAASNTGKVPNTSATAASSGTDLNGMAALDAADQIKARMAAHAARIYEVAPEEVRWEFGGIRAGRQFVPFGELASSCWMNRVQLSAAGFYSTPKIHWDRDSGRGRPFYYFAYGAAASEVTIDTLTGEYQVERADVLEDVGRSLNPAIDIGQVEGGFVQGLGWLTTEELWWDERGQLRTHAPSTYKIPVASDVPRVFNARLVDWSVNKEPVVGRSKAVGEPPFCLAISVVEALSMAVASVADYGLAPHLDMPATPERVLMAVERMRGRGEMMRAAELAAFVAAHSATVVAELMRVRGSSPRERGTFMLVAADGTLGTIGGGALEYMVIARARQALRDGEEPGGLDIPLGPEIGQCCGGRVEVSLRQLTPERAAALLARLKADESGRPHVYLFGSGHVGKALARALSSLPLRVHVVDTRPDELGELPAAVEAIAHPMPEALVRGAPRGSSYVILTHDHALDFLIAAEALKRADAPYVGMVGSRTKRAKFSSWYLSEAGGEREALRRLVLPIGAFGLVDKRPEVIAALAAAEIMVHIGRWEVSACAPAAVKSGAAVE